MRIWLDPAKLNNYGLTPSDVSSAIAAQNVQIASGELGRPAFPERSSAQRNDHRPVLPSHTRAVRQYPAESLAERRPGFACMTWPKLA